MAVSFTAIQVYKTITVTVTGLSSGDNVRIFIRLSEDSTDTTYNVYYSNVTSSTLTESYTVSYSETYVVNVSLDDGATWIGVQTATKYPYFNTYSNTTTSSTCPTFTVGCRNPYTLTGYIQLYIAGSRVALVDSITPDEYSKTIEGIEPFSYGTYSSGTYSVGFKLTSTRTGGTVYDEFQYDSITYTKSTRYYFSWVKGMVSSKPSNNLISSGDSLSDYLTADMWTELQECINNVRAYKGLDEYSFSTASSRLTYFTRVYSGDEFLAVHYNQVVKAITDINGYDPDDYYVSSGDKITAYHFNLIQQALNNIS